MQLNDAEIAFCHQVALMRRLMNRGGQVKDATKKRDFMDAETLGVIGELAFAKACNVFPRLIDMPQRGGWDCRYRGHRVDVKATRNPDGPLYVHKENADVDVYVLAVVDLPAVNFKGWVMRSQVITPENMQQDGGYVYRGQLNTGPMPAAVANA